MVTSHARYAYHHGEYQDALSLSEAAYVKNPSNVDNLLLISACHFQLGSVKESKFYAQQSTTVDPSLFEGHVAVGKCLAELGELTAAVQIYKKVIKDHPRCGIVHSELGCVYLRQNRFKDAIKCFEMGILLTPNQAEALSNLAYALSRTGDVNAAKRVLQSSKQQSVITIVTLGNILHNAGEYEDAIKCYSKALQFEPSFDDASCNLCGSLFEQYKASRDPLFLEDAVVRLRGTRSNLATAHLGVCLALLGQNRLAIKQCQMAVLCDPTNAHAVCNLAGLVFREGSLQLSTKLCFRVLELKSDCPRALNLLGMIMFQLGSPLYANKCFSTAHKIHPSPTSSVNLGVSLLNQGESIDAARLFKKAISSDPYMHSAFLNLGNAYFQIGNVDAAAKCYESFSSAKADCSSIALTNQMLLCLSQSNFGGAAEIAQRLNRSRHQEKKTSPQVRLVNEYSCDWRDFTIHHKYMTTGDSRCFTRLSSCRISLPNPLQRIKVAYISSGFGNHSTGFQTHRIFAHHDKTKFFVQAISLTPPDGSTEWISMEENVDTLVIIRQDFSSKDLARQISEEKVHILIDLDGSIHGSRPEVFAMRPAPIQVSMLGQYDSCSPQSGIDYIVADKYSLPASIQLSMRERVMYIPHLPNSYRESKSSALDFDDIDRCGIREKLGIPQEAFVYACFAQPYKITPEMFAAWMEVLNAVSNSILILVRYSRVMENNLRREIENLSVAQERVVFWDLVPRYQHLLRSCVADVILDTVCSGVCSSYDAIWTNTPLVTISGQYMVNRLGASLLNYLGLNQLIASDLDEYKQIAISLSEKEEEYIDIIRFLEDSREVGDLFKCKLWMKSYEAELERCVRDHHSPSVA